MFAISLHPVGLVSFRQVFDQAFFAAVTLLGPAELMSMGWFFGVNLCLHDTALRSTFAIGGFVAGMPLIRYTSRVLTGGFIDAFFLGRLEGIGSVLPGLL